MSSMWMARSSSAQVFTADISATNNNPITAFFLTPVPCGWSFFVTIYVWDFGMFEKVISVKKGFLLIFRAILMIESIFLE